MKKLGVPSISLIVRSPAPSAPTEAAEYIDVMLQADGLLPAQREA